MGHSHLDLGTGQTVSGPSIPVAHVTEGNLFGNVAFAKTERQAAVNALSNRLWTRNGLWPRLALTLCLVPSASLFISERHARPPGRTLTRGELRSGFLAA